MCLVRYFEQSKPWTLKNGKFLLQPCKYKLEWFHLEILWDFADPKGLARVMRTTLEAVRFCGTVLCFARCTFFYS
jgi:hypothetical protein